jgi:DNA-binding MarR family transcriptional regulator
LQSKEGPRPALPAFDLAHFTPYRLAVAAQKVSDELARIYETRHGISNPEWRVLAHLAYSGNVSVRDIEARIAMEKSKVSRAASRLEAAGLIAKAVNSGDRRLVQLTLTEKGQAVMADLVPLAIAYQAEIENRLAAAFDGFDAGLDLLLGEK